ncbi:MAG: hypothetical protein AABZ12_12900 [Planctomycetota bacterium]
MKGSARSEGERAIENRMDRRDLEPGEETMKSAKFTIEGTAPIQFGRCIQSERGIGESHDALEQRAWRERMHVDDKGRVFIPPAAVKNGMRDVSQYLGESVSGRGKMTYTKFFRAGIMVVDPLPLIVKGKTVTIDDAEPLKLFVPADGRTGGGKRVWKTFPIFSEWKTSGTIYLLDPLLIERSAKVQEYLEHMGKFIGLGVFRPQNGGYFGRFNVSKFDVA